MVAVREAVRRDQDAGEARTAAADFASVAGEVAAAAVRLVGEQRGLAAVAGLAVAVLELGLQTPSQPPLMQTTVPLGTPGHATPQSPQFAGSKLVFAHTPLQFSVPPEHCRPQAPPAQTWPPGHAIPQSPQFAWSTSVSTQSPPQSSVPPEHWSAQGPLLQTSPPPQATRSRRSSPDRRSCRRTRRCRACFRPSIGSRTARASRPAPADKCLHDRRSCSDHSAGRGSPHRTDRRGTRHHGHPGCRPHHRRTRRRSRRSCSDRSAGRRRGRRRA